MIKEYMNKLEYLIITFSLLLLGVLQENGLYSLVAIVPFILYIMESLSIRSKEKQIDEHLTILLNKQTNDDDDDKKNNNNKSE